MREGKSFVEARRAVQPPTEEVVILPIVEGELIPGEARIGEIVDAEVIPPAPVFEQPLPLLALPVTVDEGGEDINPDPKNKNFIRKNRCPCECHKAFIPLIRASACAVIIPQRNNNVEDMRVSKSDRECFVQLLAEYGLTRGGVKAAVGEFLNEKQWKDTRKNRVRLLARMRVCNPNYKNCKPEWREFYDEYRQKLRSETEARHLTRMLARDRALARAYEQALKGLDRAEGHEFASVLNALCTFIKTELEVERHERDSVWTGVSQSDTGAVRQVEPTGSGRWVRELISALESVDEAETESLTYSRR